MKYGGIPHLPPEKKQSHGSDETIAFIFVDQYNAEFNRGSSFEGGYTDNYYMQMAQ